MLCSTLDDVSADALNGTQNFFVAVGFNKPHLNWVYPEKYDTYYPDPIELPPNSNVPINYPEIAWNRCVAENCSKNAKNYSKKEQFGDTEFF